MVKYSARARQRRLRAVIYARYSSRYQHSIQDQVRVCREFAEKEGIEVVEVFTDEAKTGKSSRRDGLAKMKQALRHDDIDVLIVFSTNRLFRAASHSLRFVDEEILDGRKRCVFVRSGIDSADEGNWKMLLQMHALMDEVQCSAQTSHIRAAHEGMLLQNKVHGTLTYGYTGEPIAGALTRRGNASRRIIIDSETSKWVVKAFEWFVVERQTIRAIVQRLNEEGAPLPPRAKARWTHLAVKTLLANARYTGRWVYGAKETLWLNRKSYSIQVPREEPLKVRHDEELRIIDERTWTKAQERLLQANEKVGRRPKKGASKSRPRILNQLLICKEHQQPLQVGGGSGLYMCCKYCRELPDPPLYSLLNRELALQLVCQRLAELIVADEELTQRSVDAAIAFAEEFQKSDAPELDDIKRRKSRLDAQIKFILDAPGTTETDQAENREHLSRLRLERAKAETDLASIAARNERREAVPTQEQVREQLQNLTGILLRAAESDDPKEQAAARDAIELLTGGVIQVSQCGERSRQKGWLRLTFEVNLVSAVCQSLNFHGQGDKQTVEIDVIRPDVSQQLVERAAKLYEQGKLIKVIAAELDCSRNIVTALLKRRHESQGLPWQDGRSRRTRLAAKSLDGPRHQQIADRVMDMYRDGTSDSEMARILSCSDQLIRSAREWWYQSRGLKPLGANKRLPKDFQTELARLYDEHVPLTEIAGRLGVSCRTVTKAARKLCKERGIPYVDGRTRRRERWVE